MCIRVKAHRQTPLPQAALPSSGLGLSPTKGIRLKDRDGDLVLILTGTSFLGVTGPGPTPHTSQPPPGDESSPTGPSAYRGWGWRPEMPPSRLHERLVYPFPSVELLIGLVGSVVTSDVCMFLFGNNTLELQVCHFALVTLLSLLSVISFSASYPSARWRFHTRRNGRPSQP